MGIRAETRNYRELSSIYGHFTIINPHKQGRIENYQEFCNEYVGVTFGVRCNLDRKVVAEIVSDEACTTQAVLLIAGNIRCLARGGRTVC